MNSHNKPKKKLNTQGSFFATTGFGWERNFSDNHTHTHNKHAYARTRAHAKGHCEKKS